MSDGPNSHGVAAHGKKYTIHVYERPDKLLQYEILEGDKTIIERVNSQACERRDNTGEPPQQIYSGKTEVRMMAIIAPQKSTT